MHFNHRLLRASTSLGLVLLAATPQLFAAERQVLIGHVPQAIVGGPASLRRLPPGTQLDLAIGLPLREQESLSKLLADLYSPASFRYY